MEWIEQAVIDNLDKKIEENIGLKNVHQRLKLLYGEGLNITKLEQGTRIKFKITWRCKIWLSCIIVEDELPAREELKYFIDEEKEIKLIAEFDNPLDTLTFFGKKYCWCYFSRYQYAWYEWN